MPLTSSKPVAAGETGLMMTGVPGKILQSPSEREEGFFTKYNKLTNAMHLNVIPRFLDSLDKVTMKSGGPFVICDYGCGDGGMVMDMFIQSIRTIRKKYEENVQINIIYEDLPTLNYRPLFKRTQGLMNGCPGFGADVYVSAAGTSFYKQCVPDESVDIGFSSLAFHWMSNKPSTLKDSALSALATDQKEIEAFRKQGAEDWSTILLHRSKEIRRGGRLFIVMCGTDSDGDFLGKEKFYNNVHYIWETMFNEGIITKDELEHVVFPMYFRTEEEIRAPFKQTDSGVVKNGLRMVSMDWVKTMDPLLEAWKHSNLSGNTKKSRAYAHMVTKSFMAWNYDAQADCFHGRHESERIIITDTFYQRYEDKMAADPLWHDMHLPTVIIQIEKV